MIPRTDFVMIYLPFSFAATPRVTSDLTAL